MWSSARFRLALLTGIVAIAAVGVHGQAQNGAPAARPTPNADILDPVRSFLPNPNPMVVKGFGALPDGRMWGSTAGVAIGPDQNVWAYDRCGTNTCLDSTLAPSSSSIARRAGCSRTLARGGRTDFASRGGRRPDQVHQTLSFSRRFPCDVPAFS